MVLTPPTTITKEEEKVVVVVATKDGSVGCNQLHPGDVSFFMVQPAKESDTSNTYNKTEEDLYQHHDSFGLVSLVNLQPGLVLFVAGVDDDNDDDYYDDTGAPQNERIREHDEGIVKVSCILSTTVISVWILISTQHRRSYDI